jgi:hypothetical protein
MDVLSQTAAKASSERVKRLVEDAVALPRVGNGGKGGRDAGEPAAGGVAGIDVGMVNEPPLEAYGGSAHWPPRPSRRLREQRPVRPRRG